MLGAKSILKTTHICLTLIDGTRRAYLEVQMDDISAVQMLKALKYLASEVDRFFFCEKIFLRNVIEELSTTESIQV